MSNTAILEALIQNKPISELAINGKEVKELYIDNKRIYPKLPPIYTELEYIESNSTNKQYLKTGIKPTANYTISVDFRLTKNTATWDTIFGTRNGNAERFTARFYNKTGSAGTLGVQRSISSSATQYQSAELYDVTKNTAMDGFHNATFAKNIFYFDGVQKKSFSTSISKIAFSYEWYLFALNDLNTATDFGSFKIKLCTIKDYNGNLVRHFIPCKNLKDEVGMYDLINKQFYGSSGSAAFIPGPEV
jgi:hypothetical protein